MRTTISHIVTWWRWGKTHKHDHSNGVTEYEYTEALDLYFQQTKKNLRSISLATSNQPNNIPAKHTQISWVKEYAGFLTKIIQ